MNDELLSLFPWANAQKVESQRIEYDGIKNARSAASEPGEKQTNPVTIGFGFRVNNEPYIFVPESVINKGVQSQNYQFYIPAVLQPDFQNKLQNAQLITVGDLAQKRNGDLFLEQFSQEGFGDEKGYLFPKSVFDSFKTASGQVAEAYKIGFVGSEGVSTGPIQGLSVVNGRPVYATSASGRENAQSYIYYDPQFKEGKSGVIWQEWYEPGEKWYETPLGQLGIALIAGGTAGLALGGAGAAAGTGAAGTGTAAGIVGTPGVSTIFPVAAPVAPTVTTIAPMATAGVAGGYGLLEGATFPSQGLSVPAINSAEVALLPQGTAVAGQGLQVPTLPGLSAMGGGTGLAVGVPGGTVTQLGFVPTGATPVLGDPASFINNPDVLGNTVFSTDYLAAPGAANGVSAMDALRLANQTMGLLGAGQNPIVPQQQGLPQSAAGSQGVDYSGLLSLLQLQARTPGVSSLTAPAQLRQIYQPTLLPNVLSLLG